MDKDLAVYVLVRNDLPSQNSGKAMAQTHHAGVQLVNKYLNGYSSPLVKEYIEAGKVHGADNFNTTLVLSATIDQINTVISIGQMLHAVCDIVTDPSYPFFVDSELAPFVEKDPAVTRIGPSNGKVLFVRPEVTCGWILLDRNDPVMRSIVGAMPLHP